LYADDSRMGHVAHGPLVPRDRVPVLLASASDVLHHIKPDPAAGPMHFRLKDIVEPPVSDGLPLMPFFRLHDQRYQMYWQLTTKEELDAKRERLAAEERAKAVREANTLDRVAVGEQQPEVEHDLAVTYWGGDAGRALDILANGELLATETLDDSRPGQFFEKRYAIPAEVLSSATNDRITIKFSAKPGSRPAGVYDVRLMKPDSPAGAAQPGSPVAN
jgi:uncharacterized protein